MEIERQHLHQIANACSMLKLPIPQNILEQLEKIRPISAPYHKNIYKCLLQQNYKVEMEALVESYFVDLYFPEDKLIIELDDAIHDTLSKKQTDKLRDEVLRQNFGMTIYRIKMESKTQNEITNEIIDKINEHQTKQTSQSNNPSTFFQSAENNNIETERTKREWPQNVQSVKKSRIENYF